MEKTFAAIDLKSFYASVECQERSLNPLTTNLVVADASRTEKTICLAISPSLKSYGLPGRARLFQVLEKVKTINAERLQKAPLGVFLGKTTNNLELQNNPNLALDFIIATPRMQYYLDYSAKIYQIYLKHVAPCDIFAYSIDEVFCDLSSYLANKHQTANEFVTTIINDVYQQTGITATAGIGTNLFLAKVAMDILAKHTKPNVANVRIAELTEQTFREQLWDHTPITDFWRIGRGYAKRLAKYNLLTMGDIARCSLKHPDILYQTFGVNAELLIDHSWGYENVAISDIKNHHPETKSISSGQVLSSPYPFHKARIIVKEMAEALSLELVRQRYITSHLTLHIQYDCKNPCQAKSTIDHYGRKVPKPAQGGLHLDFPTASTKLIIAGFLEIFNQQVNPNLYIRKITVVANDLIAEDSVSSPEPMLIQTDLFTNYAKLEQIRISEQQAITREQQIQQAILHIRQRYGKNSILRGTSFEDGATMRTRHHQIGGHKA